MTKWNIILNGKKYKIAVRRDWDGDLLHWATKAEVAEIFGEQVAAGKRLPSNEVRKSGRRYHLQETCAHVLPS